MRTGNNSKVIDTVRIVRACDHIEEFQLFEKDPYRKQRADKFSRTRCSACSAKSAEEHNAKQALGMTVTGELIRGQEYKQFPAGAELYLLRQTDGRWSGRLVIDDQEFQLRNLKSLALVSQAGMQWAEASGIPVLKKMPKRSLKKTQESPTP